MTDVSEVHADSIIRASSVKSTTVLPRRFWASYSPPWELEISHINYHWLLIFYLWGKATSLNCCHEWAYCSPPRWHEFGERRWYDIDRGNPKNSEQNLSQCHFVHQKSHMDWPGSEPGPPRWEAGTNRLSHGTAHWLLIHTTKLYSH
jgi:hypothetical protein